MTKSEAEVLVQKYWAAEGYCRTCGWRASLKDYFVTLTKDMEIDRKLKCIRLHCLADDGLEHRGVRIGFPQ